MSTRRACVSLWITFFLAMLLVATSICVAEQVTRNSGRAELDSLKEYYTIPNFRLGGDYEIGREAAYEFGGEGGVTLESLGQPPLKLAYIAVGTPKKDKDGKITNAVLISSYWSGDSTWSYFFWYDGQKGNGFSEGPVVGPGKMIDTNKFYVVFADALALWGTSKPSDGLGMKFPTYSCFDMVQANYRLLRDHLGVSKVKLATGVSMGAMQAYVLALLHRDFVEAIMPIGGCTAAEPVMRWRSQLMSAAMKSDPAWMNTKGDYYSLPKKEHPNRGLMFGWSLMDSFLYDVDFRNNQPWDKLKGAVFSWQPKEGESTGLVDKALDYDVNDLLKLNRALRSYDINKHLHRIQAKTLILHITNDQTLRFAKAKEAARKIPGAKVAHFESPLAHMAIFRAPNRLKTDVQAFLREIGMLD